MQLKDGENNESDVSLFHDSDFITNISSTNKTLAGFFG